MVSLSGPGTASLMPHTSPVEPSDRATSSFFFYSGPSLILFLSIWTHHAIQTLMLALLLLPESQPSGTLTKSQPVWITPQDEPDNPKPALLVPVPGHASQQKRLREVTPPALPVDPPSRPLPILRSSPPLAERRSKRGPAEPPFRYVDLKGQLQTLHRVVQCSNGIFDPQSPEWRAAKPPREWPTSLAWPQDAMRCRAWDDRCMVCGRKAGCGCDVAAWRAAHGWATVRELRMVAGKGIGCFTRRTWLAGELLGDYCGEIRPYNDFEHNPYCLAVSVFGSSSRRIAMIDSLAVGNWTRFVNHSCNANLRFKESNVGGSRIYALVAIRNIQVDEELTVDYGPGYMGPNGECSCGEDTCRHKKRRRLSPRK